MPAKRGMKARTPGVKRAIKTLLSPCREKKASLRATSSGYRFSGQRLRISRWYRCPSQNERPSPVIAPTVAATSSGQSATTPLGTKALIARITAEPGTTTPMIGIDSDRASRNTAA
jgi:hypothetical protein